MLQKNFVSTEIIQHTEQMSDKVRCGTLLDAVETQIKASPAQLQIFISTLEEQATMQTIADVLSNACCEFTSFMICLYITCLLM